MFLFFIAYSHHIYYVRRNFFLLQLYVNSLLIYIFFIRWKNSNLKSFKFFFLLFSYSFLTKIYMRDLVKLYMININSFLSPNGFTRFVNYRFLFDSITNTNSVFSTDYKFFFFMNYILALLLNLLFLFGSSSWNNEVRKRKLRLFSLITICLFL